MNGTAAFTGGYRHPAGRGPGGHLSLRPDGAVACGDPARRSSTAPTEIGAVWTGTGRPSTAPAAIRPCASTTPNATTSPLIRGKPDAERRFACRAGCALPALQAARKGALKPGATIRPAGGEPRHQRIERPSAGRIDNDRRAIDVERHAAPLGGGIGLVAGDERGGRTHDTGGVAAGRDQVGDPVSPMHHRATAGPMPSLCPTTSWPRVSGRVGFRAG